MTADEAAALVLVLSVFGAMVAVSGLVDVAFIVIDALIGRRGE